MSHSDEKDAVNTEDNFFIICVVPLEMKGTFGNDAFRFREEWFLSYSLLYQAASLV